MNNQSTDIDLCCKVISAIDNGMGKTEASRVFQMSRNTIDLWLKQRERENTLAPKPRFRTGMSSETS